jgi:hypothetical protein
MITLQLTPQEATNLKSVLDLVISRGMNDGQQFPCMRMAAYVHPLWNKIEVAEVAALDAAKTAQAAQAVQTATPDSAATPSSSQ